MYITCCQAKGQVTDNLEMVILHLQEQYFGFEKEKIYNIEKGVLNRR